MSTATDLELIQDLDYDDDLPCEWEEQHWSDTASAADYWWMHCITMALCRPCTVRVKTVVKFRTRPADCKFCGTPGVPMTELRYLGPVRG